MANTGTPCGWPAPVQKPSPSPARSGANIPVSIPILQKMVDWYDRLAAQETLSPRLLSSLAYDLFMCLADSLGQRSIQKGDTSTVRCGPSASSAKPRPSSVPIRKRPPASDTIPSVDPVLIRDTGKP